MIPNVNKYWFKISQLSRFFFTIDFYQKDKNQKSLVFIPTHSIHHGLEIVLLNELPVFYIHILNWAAKGFPTMPSA